MAAVPPACDAAMKCHVGFIGLGAMGSGMAAALLRSGFPVTGFDVHGPSMERFKSLGGSTAATCAEAAEGADVLVVMVTTAQQAEGVLLGANGAAAALPNSAVVILCSTVPPGFTRSLSAKLKALSRGLLLVDAPVSGGVARAAEGTLTIMAAAEPAAIKKAKSVLEAMAQQLYIVGTEPGPGSAVKMVNQLLAGVHIAAAAEAMALGARAGLNTRLLFDIISHAAGNSWMFENRVPHMLDGDYSPRSALNIFVKDLGIVLGEAQSLTFPLPLAASAHQQFLAGSAAGLGREDDAAVVKVYERLAGVTVASPTSSSSSSAPSASASAPSAEARLNKQQTLAALPPEWQMTSATSAADNDASATSSSGSRHVVVILDDDPTGTQTVHGITVLTKWDVASLVEQLSPLPPPAGLFILTNSRALPTDEAARLTEEVCGVVLQAAEQVNSSYVMSSQGDGDGDGKPSKLSVSFILRGDSTLRGHYPQEVWALESLLGASDLCLLCPFFLEGGRFTINDVHYVAEGEDLVPAAETEFARDAAFGYSHSNLKEWVEEKTAGRTKAADVASIPISLIRKEGPNGISRFLLDLPKGSTVVANAAADSDLQAVAAAIEKVEAAGRSVLCRSAASFVSARLKMTKIAPLQPSDFGISKSTAAGRRGGLIVVGSYVPKTTKQVEKLKESRSGHLTCIEVNAAELSSSNSVTRDAAIRLAAEAAEASVAAGVDTLVVTSRQLMTSADKKDSLAIGGRISDGLVEIVRRIKIRPRYILAKGGITSSDVATKGLNVTQAVVAGQALPGVPLWRLLSCSTFPDLPYIVFPGNVGSEDAVAEVVARWADVAPATTQTLLNLASSGGYAVGAFNVYNLEGVSAVVAAAEAENSPAILQLHPASLRHGGAPLVAACLAAANGAKVPITVHLDHATCPDDISSALRQGFHSVMIDASHASFDENVAITSRVVQAAKSAQGALVEAELGRLAGEEDGVSVDEIESKLTNVAQADDFIVRTGIQALAVCVGNRHGPYPPNPSGIPVIDFERLKDLQGVASKNKVHLVLHGASGLDEAIVKACIKHGVCKFNVNTEVRRAYLKALKDSQGDIVDVLKSSQDAMVKVIREKLVQFGSSGKA